MRLLILLLFICATAIILSCNNSDRVKIYDKGVNIAYTDTGTNDTTLLFVHGWCINKSYWSGQATYFGERYRVVAIDLPGFGQSGKDRHDWSTEAFSRDVDSVITQLKLKKVILVGHSMAGDIVLQSALDNPQTVIGLAVVDIFKNVGKNEVQTPQAKKAYTDAIDSLKHHFKKIAFEYFNQDLFYKTTPIAVKKRILNDVAQVDTAIAAACMQQGNFTEQDKLRKLKVKLYLINSATKPTDTSYFATNKIPFKLLYIYATGHFPMVEKPEEFNRLLDEVVGDVGAKGRN